MKTLLFLLATTVCFAQATINAPAVTLDADGTVAVQTWMAGQSTGIQTTLSAPISAAATTITVASGLGIGNNAVIAIGNEHIQVTNRTGNTLTVTRGANGTTAASALSGATVTELRYRSMNALAKQVVVDVLRQIVRQAELKAAADAAANAAETKAAAAVQ